MIDINEEYEKEIKSLIEKFGPHWRRSLESKGKDSRHKSNEHLLNYVLERTHFLDNIQTDLKTRVVCCLRHVTEVPRCQNPKCGKPLSKYFIDNVVEEHPRETMFCSHKCIYEARESPDAFIYFDKQYPTKEEKIEFLRKLVTEKPRSFQRILQGCNYKEVANWIYNAVPKLQDKIYNVSTRLYWILNGFEDFPTCACKGCNNKIGIGKNIEINRGYAKNCSAKCAANNPETQAHFRETSNRIYHKDNPWQAESVKSKIKETRKKKTGYESFFQTPECRELSKKALHEKKEKADIERKNKKEKLERIKKEQLIGSSIAEDQIFEWLKYVFKEDVVQHYKSDKYPYSCDFYIKPLDLYVEYNGLWTHGGHPYDSSSKEDAKILDFMRSKKSQYYKNAIYVWTNLDVKKRKTAKENHLNFIEWWNMNEAALWIVNNSNVHVPFELLMKYKFKASIFNLYLVKESQKEESEKKKEISEAYSLFLKLDFPFPSSTSKEISNEVARLTSSEQHSDKLYSPIIRQYCPTIWKCQSHGTMSPYDYWNYLKSDFDAFKRLYDNRIKYKGKVTPDILREGMNIAKMAGKVTYLKPFLAKRLIKTYLPEATSIFNPFNGFSGIMLGATLGCNKHYVGQDLNSDFVAEANNMISDFSLDAEVKVQDIFTDKEQEHEALFCCLPYEDLEQWNYNSEGKCVDKNLTCDEWIDVVLSKYKCKQYLFVVDKTEKYKDKIVEVLGNASHLNENCELVLRF